MDKILAGLIGVIALVAIGAIIYTALPPKDDKTDTDKNKEFRKHWIEDLKSFCSQSKQRSEPSEKGSYVLQANNPSGHTPFFTDGVASCFLSTDGGMPYMNGTVCRGIDHLCYVSDDNNETCKQMHVEAEKSGLWPESNFHCEPDHVPTQDDPYCDDKSDWGPSAHYQFSYATQIPEREAVEKTTIHIDGNEITCPPLSAVCLRQHIDGQDFDDKASPPCYDRAKSGFYDYVRYADDGEKVVRTAIQFLQ